MTGAAVVRTWRRSQAPMRRALSRGGGERTAAGSADASVAAISARPMGHRRGTGLTCRSVPRGAAGGRPEGLLHPPLVFLDLRLGATECARETCARCGLGAAIEGFSTAVLHAIAAFQQVLIDRRVSGVR